MQRLLAAACAIFAAHGSLAETEVSRIQTIDSRCDAPAYGFNVDIDGDWLVAAAGHYDDLFDPAHGYACVYKRSGPAGWLEVAVLEADDPDYFGMGFRAAIEGDTIVVGSIIDESWPDTDRAAFVFQRTAGTDNWVFVKRLIPGIAGASIRFGVDVGISGDTIIVSDQKAEQGDGRVFVYERHAGGVDNWGQVAILASGITDPGMEFGRPLAIDGDVIAAVARHLDAPGGAVDAGGAIIFRRDQTGVWNNEAQIYANDPNSFDEFGFSLALDNERIAIGARGKWGGDGSHYGWVYLYERDSRGVDPWPLVLGFRSNQTVFADRFGTSVALDGNRMLVGAAGVKIGSTLSAGSAYLFQQVPSTGEWTQTRTLRASDPVYLDLLGVAVRIGPGELIVGGIGDTFTDPAGQPGKLLIYPPPIANDIDSDADGWLDIQDNCTNVENTDQRDTDFDGIGNVCDADLSGDCVVNFSDLQSLKNVFFSTDPNADFDGDGQVNFPDLSIMKSMFFAAPGPSVNECQVWTPFHAPGARDAEQDADGFENPRPY